MRARDVSDLLQQACRNAQAGYDDDAWESLSDMERAMLINKEVRRLCPDRRG